VSPVDPVVVKEIPVIRKIIQDEMWLEGERRGCQVPPDDRVVRENVCRVILQVGQQLREWFTHASPSGRRPQVPTTVTFPSVFVPDGADWQI
jgi:hypothetical protein